MMPTTEANILKSIADSKSAAMSRFADLIRQQPSEPAAAPAPTVEAQPAPKQRRTSGRLAAVLLALRSCQPATAKQVADITGRRIEYVSSVICQAKANGLIETAASEIAGRKAYCLTDKGRAYRCKGVQSAAVKPTAKPKPSTRFALLHPEHGLIPAGSTIEEAGTAARAAALRFDCHIPVLKLVRVGTAAPARTAHFVEEMA